jgi:putative membrane protein
MRKILIGVIVIALSVSFLGYATAWERSYHWSWGPWGFGTASFFLIPLFLVIAFCIAVIVGFVYFIKWIIAAGKGHETKTEETALDILKKRYAKGEITKEEFERIKQDIR